MDASEFSGAISGTGGLVKQGGGNFTLSGTNAYSGTGRELLKDPKVIELYLGTLART